MYVYLLASFKENLSVRFTNGQQAVNTPREAIDQKTSEQTRVTVMYNHQALDLGD